MLYYRYTFILTPAMLVCTLCTMTHGQDPIEWECIGTLLKMFLAMTSEARRRQERKLAQARGHTEVGSFPTGIQWYYPLVN